MNYGWIMGETAPLKYPSNKQWHLSVFLAVRELCLRHGWSARTVDWILCYHCRRVLGADAVDLSCDYQEMFKTKKGQVPFRAYE